MLKIQLSKHYTDQSRTLICSKCNKCLLYPETQPKELRAVALLLESIHTLHGVSHHSDSSRSHLPAAPRVYQRRVPEHHHKASMKTAMGFMLLQFQSMSALYSTILVYKPMQAVSTLARLMRTACLQMLHTGKLMTHAGFALVSITLSLLLLAAV